MAKLLWISRTALIEKSRLWRAEEKWYSLLPGAITTAALREATTFAEAAGESIDDATAFAVKTNEWAVAAAVASGADGG